MAVIEPVEMFQDRHIGTDAAAQATMLAAVGYPTVDALVNAAVPPSIHVKPLERSSIPAAASERDALAELRRLAGKNRVRRSMIGLGYYDTITPAVIKRNVLENPSWYTAYTPYQPEISQGRLEALINFQTMVSELTGLATANASMLDEGTAVVEAMLLARRASGSASNVFLVDADALPQTKALLRTRAEAVGIELREARWSSSGEAAYRDPADGFDTPSATQPAFGALIQYPGASGRVWDPREAISAVQAQGGVAVVAAAVYNSGLLSRSTVPDHALFDYAPADRLLVERARHLAAVCERHGVELPAAAAQYPLRHPEVVSVVLGTRTADQAREGVARLRAPIPEDLWAELEAEGLVEARVR